MCGIAGVIGRSKSPQVSYEILTKLFEKSEKRGTDAAGFWGAQPGEDGAIVYHKEPFRSSVLVTSNSWKSMRKFNPNLCIMHARATSQGIGSSATNRNNHPFVSCDRRIALIHNGRVYESTTISRRYEVASNCDSEVLLRVYEECKYRNEMPKDEDLANFPDDHLKEIAGIKDIFSYAHSAHMAVAIAEYEENTKRVLWFFRNEHRPLWVIDAREILGQVFFCSEDAIWKEAVLDVHNANKLLRGRRHRIYEVPKDEIWRLSIDDENPHVDLAKGGLIRYKIINHDKYVSLQDVKDKHPIRSAADNKKITIISLLNDRDEITEECRITTSRKSQAITDLERDLNNVNHKSTNVPVSVTPGRTLVGPKPIGTYPNELWNRDQNTSVDEYEGAINIDADFETPDGETIEIFDECNDGLDDQYDRDVLDDNEGDIADEEHEGLTPLDLELPPERVAPKVDRVRKRIDEERKAVGYDTSTRCSYDTDALSRVVERAKRLVCDVETEVLNQTGSQSISSRDFLKTKESMENVVSELESILKVLESV